MQAARDEGRVLWATHLHATAAPLEAPLTLPPRLAVVMGSERYGVSDTMRHAADLVRGVEGREGRRHGGSGNKGLSHRIWLSGVRGHLQVVYLPMYGFVESLNVTVASALVLQVRVRVLQGVVVPIFLFLGSLTQRTPPQRLFDLCPDARGDLSHEVRTAALRQWTARGLVARHVSDIQVGHAQLQPSHRSLLVSRSTTETVTCFAPGVGKGIQ